jgi:hypothetical protein
MMNEVLPSRSPHWSKGVSEVVAFFANDTAEAQQNAIETIKATFGYEAAEWATEEFAKLAAKAAPAKPATEAPAWMAKLEPFEDWDEWLAAAVAIAVEGAAAPADIAAEADRWGEGGAEEFRAALHQSNSAAQEEEQPAAAMPEPVEAEAQPEPAGLVQLPAVIPPRPVAKYDAAIEALNANHAVIDNVGGKTVIASWEPSLLDPTKLIIVFQTKESFLLRYSNRFALIDSPDGHGGSHSRSQPMGQWWLSHRDRRQHRGVTFMPNGPPETDNGCLNLWQGWGVSAAPGDWSLIREHIERIVADGNAEFANYVIRWIAWSIQNPARQAEVALVLIRSKGAGKGTLVRCLQRIFGAHAFQVTSREEVIGKFNGHLQDCILFIADEAYWGGDKRCVGRLQGMITEPTLPIERKGIDVIQVRNFLHVVMLAEPGWVIPAGRHERRYAALAVSDTARGDRQYFNALHRQIDEGGAEAMMFNLRQMDLDGWHPREIPEALLKGSALQKQQGHTLPPLEQWYMMLLHNGVLPGALPTKPNKANTRSLVDHARANYPRLKFDLTENGLRDFLIDAERIGLAIEKHRTAQWNGWSFPPLGECREAFDRLYGPIAWDHPEVLEWSKKVGLLD